MVNLWTVTTIVTKLLGFVLIWLKAIRMLWYQQKIIKIKHTCKMPPSKFCHLRKFPAASNEAAINCSFTSWWWWKKIQKQWNRHKVDIHILGTAVSSFDACLKLSTWCFISSLWLYVFNLGFGSLLLFKKHALQFYSCIGDVEKVPKNFYTGRHALN